MPTPVNSEAVKSFIEMTEYFQKLLPKLSEVAKPLKDLICQDVQFYWESSHKKLGRRLRSWL